MSVGEGEIEAPKSCFLGAPGPQQPPQEAGRCCNSFGTLPGVLRLQRFLKVRWVCFELKGALVAARTLFGECLW